MKFREKNNRRRKVEICGAEATNVFSVSHHQGVYKSKQNTYFRKANLQKSNTVKSRSKHFTLTKFFAIFL